MIPVVFLHGIGGGARSFAPQIASFAARSYQPVALDLPGYGGRAPVDAMTFDALAEDVEASIAKSALEKPVLVGRRLKIDRREPRLPVKFAAGEIAHGPAHAAPPSMRRPASTRDWKFT